MKNIRFLLFALAIATLVLSACGAAAVPNTGSGKVEAMPVTFIGTIDSIAGDQWVISGTTVTVDTTVVRDGPFNVGDQVKVEGVVNPDGSLTVSRVEIPGPKEIATLPPFSDTNTNDTNANDNANVNDGNINDDNSNGLNSNDGNLNDDNGNSSNSNDDDNGNSSNSNDDDRDDDSRSDSNSNGNGGRSDDDDHNGNGGNDDSDHDDSNGNSDDD